MSDALKQLLSACTVIGTMLLLASTAFAQTLEVTDEDTGTHCSAVTISGTDVNGGCLGHVNGEVELRKHVFGIETHVTKCRTEKHGRVNEDGEGWIFEHVTTSIPGQGPCTRQACKDGAGEVIPWLSHGNESANGHEAVTTALCLEPTGGGTDEICEVTATGILVGDHAGQEDAGEKTAHGLSGFRCEFVGSGDSEQGGTHDGESEVGGEVAHVP